MVAVKEDVLEGGRVVVDVDGIEIGIFRLGREALRLGEPLRPCRRALCQGKLMNRVVERLDAGKRSLGDDFSDELHIVCPWHGYEYDVRTGEHPADSRLRLRPVEVEEREGEIVVRL